MQKYAYCASLDFSSGVEHNKYTMERKFNMGNTNKFEGQIGELPEQIDVVSSDEILGQLNISAAKYEKLLGDLRVGDLSNVGYAEEMLKNLTGYKDLFFQKQKDKELTPKEKEIAVEVVDRWSTLRDLLQTAKTSH